MLVNAAQMALAHPKSFERPCRQALDLLACGDLAKVCSGDERFWVVITERNGDVLKGTVANMLVGDQPYDYGDLIAFHMDNVYDASQMKIRKL
jgi:hypothetical protein